MDFKELLKSDVYADLNLSLEFNSKKYWYVVYNIIGILIIVGFNFLWDEYNYNYGSNIDGE